MSFLSTNNIVEKSQGYISIQLVDGIFLVVFHITNGFILKRLRPETVVFVSALIFYILFLFIFSELGWWCLSLLCCTLMVLTRLRLRYDLSMWIFEIISWFPWKFPRRFPRKFPWFPSRFLSKVPWLPRRVAISIEMSTISMEISMEFPPNRQ